MPGYTHLQPAQPTTVAHWACSYESAVRRDTERLLDAHERINESPLGAAAFAGTTFDIDRERTAELLGFEGRRELDGRFLEPGFPARDDPGAIDTRDDPVGLAEDVIVFANRGFVPSRTTTPRRRRSCPRRRIRTHSSSSAPSRAMRRARSRADDDAQGTPRAYNRDLQRATPHAWETVDAVAEASSVAAGAVATAEWNDAALAAEAGDGSRRRPASPTCWPRTDSRSGRPTRSSRARPNDSRTPTPRNRISTPSRRPRNGPRGTARVGRRPRGGRSRPRPRRERRESQLAWRTSTRRGRVTTRRRSRGSHGRRNRPRDASGSARGGPSDASCRGERLCVSSSVHDRGGDGPREG